MFNKIKLGSRKNKNQKIKPPTDEVTLINYEFSCAQHIGGREEQQDAFGYLEGINSQMGVDFIAVLCDGMGGMTDGAKISHYAVEKFLEDMSKVTEHIPEAIERSVSHINEEVLAYAMATYGKASCGSTLVTVIMDQGKMYWAALGDSRIYFLRDGRIMRVNTPHHYLSMLMQKVMMGEETRQEAMENPDGRKLTGYLGCPHNPSLDKAYRPFKLKKGDRIILSSDGLFDVLTDDEIARLAYSVPNQMVANRLVSEVIERQQIGQDNVTVCYLCYKGD